MRGRSFTIIQGFLIFCCWAIAPLPDIQAQTALQVSPASVTLEGPEASQQILVRSSKPDADLTRSATYEVLNPKIAAVDAVGLVWPKAEGETVLVVRHDKQEAHIPVAVTRQLLTSHTG